MLWVWGRVLCSGMSSPFQAEPTLLSSFLSYSRDRVISMMPKQPGAALDFHWLPWNMPVKPACEDRPFGDGSLGKEWEGNKRPQSDSGMCIRRLRPTQADLTLWSSAPHSASASRYPTVPAGTVSCCLVSQQPLSS